MGDDDALSAAFRHARAYLEGLESEPVAPRLDRTDLLRRLERPLGEFGVPAEQVVDELARDCAPGLVGSAGGRFFGWVIGSALPAGVAADWLTSVWDQNAALHACSPAAAITEEVAGGWLKEILRLPPQSSFAFTTGCQMAHVTSMAAARSALLRRRGWDAAEDGLAGAPAIRVLASDNGHGSVHRAAALLGMGRGCVQGLATDGIGRIGATALSEALAQSDAPTVVVLQAGDIATGAFDDFALVPLAHAAGAWVHIDGAFGLWARSSGRFQALADGCEQADSWATDGHKILNTPFDAGYAILACPEDHRAAFGVKASYLTHSDEARDQIDWNPDWSRRARGFATYATLRSLGRKGVAELFDSRCELARALAEGLAALNGAELVSAPIINQALVRFHDPGRGADETAHDWRTDAIIEAVNASGEAFFTGATWKGRRVMRISVVSWRTGPSDVARAIEATRQALAKM